MGDLNNCMIQKTSRSKLMNNLLESYNLKLINRKPTHHIHNSNTLLDLLITSVPSKVVVSAQQHAYQFSHHDLIYAAFKFKCPKPIPRVIECRDLKRVDQTLLIQATRTICWESVYKTDSLDEKVKIFSDKILEVYDRLAPLKAVRVRHPPCPWLTD
ncbi:uncharacterized protein LOC123683013 [Harmonia axyridis]|uniref:uncharacterized protein LOC123683013 n=1 Tax=Harmonia axyridis TaxID=115357 RepID=UPI001E2794B0|nr:uncharacterized protein LOC123683013 [Harmonia axyridis]